MLVRAARRKVRPEAIRSRFSCDHPQLPWPRPAHITAPGARRWGSIDSGSQTVGLRKRSNSQDASKRPGRRSLATIVGYRDDIPFEGMGSMPPPSASKLQGDRGFPDYSNLPSYDSANPIYLGGSIATAQPRLRANHDLGMGGSVVEIQAVLEACLQVGRIERAEVIFRRLLKSELLTPDEELDLHNRYLRASVEQIILHPSEAGTQRLHSWFELQIRAKGVPADFETLAYMVKASLQAQRGQRERLVRRYMDMLDEQSVLQLLVAEILTAREINEITHIYPKYNFAQQPLEDAEILPVEQADLSGLPSAQPESGLPAVRPTEQKGLGLKTLKKSLSLFSRLSEEKFDISSATPQERRDIQSKLEQDAVESAIDRWREESENLNKMGIDTQLQTKSLGARMWKWQVELERYLKAEIDLVGKAEDAEQKTVRDKSRCEIGPFLRVLPTDQLAATVILSLMKTMGSVGVDKGVSLASAITAIAGTVEDESIFQQLQRDMKKKMWPSKDSGEFSLTPEFLLRAMKTRGPGSASKLVEFYATQHNRSYASQTPWTTSTKAKLGAFLMSALIEVAKVPVTLTHKETGDFVTQMQPAFSHSHQYKMGKKFGIIVANKVLVQQLKSDPVHSVLAKHLPMLVEPEPWTRFDKGGFIVHPARVMRVKNGDQDQRCYAEAAAGQGDMTRVFKGLDILGKTSWQINQPVFDVMLEAWNSGEAIASMPPDSPNLSMPPEPQASQDPLERRRWIRAVKSIENQRIGMHSQRCFQNFQLEIARALRNETFYFPHNVDFRGRAYPIPPYLNHMGADHCRGLLRFGKGKELGAEGLRWLKIHVSNVFGYDKASLSERESFAMNHLEDVYDSALKPLNGSRWWLKAEDPWQCLAACMELRSALESPIPEAFVSHLPIHQDGTCNGLQHYAALGGDSWGAKQVNLEPGDRPADVYTAVANLVIESINKDRVAGDQRAILLEGKVSRKTVKQTVMTNVYGVTYIGAKAQVRKQLLAANPDLPNEDNLNSGILAAYIATKIFTALSSMFRGAHDIQYWLGECAQRISTSITPEQLGLLEAQWPALVATATNDISATKDTPKSRKPRTKAGSVDMNEILQYKSSVIWTNPLHMPIVQPYRKANAKIVKTKMQYITLMDPHRSDPVDRRKQLQGFPPNFIHSLDATHMLLSALRCDELGLSFAAVHDSFWTHACDVKTMNGVLRDAFIQIHGEDVIGRLRTEFEARYKDSMYCAKIKNGSPVYKKIKAWRDTEAKRWARIPRAKKIPRIDELMLERKRLRLLKSSDPAEVEEGRKMVTPGSIFADMARDGDLAVEEDLKNIGLGDMSVRAKKLAADQEIAVGDKANIEEIDNPLEGGEQLDAELADRAEADLEGVEAESMMEDTEDAQDGEATSFEKSLQAPKRVASKDTEVWLPLTFPPVPQKVTIFSSTTVCIF
jgi:DNA-directed RNA polymerase